MQLKENANDGDLLDAVENKVAQRINKTRFDMELFNTLKQSDLRLKPPMWAYRHQTTSANNSNSPRYLDFMNDLTLFEVEMREPSMYVSKELALSEQDLFQSMCSEISGKRRDVVLALRKPQHLATMGVRRVCVKVGPNKGHMIVEGVNLVERGRKRCQRDFTNRTLLSHVQFVITE